MRILLLCHSFNSLTQRLHVELREAGHEVSVEFDVNDAVTCEAVALFRPDVVIAPFLKRAIPEDVWRSVRCLVVHPGVRGDKGPSALDWAILEGEASWGVTLIEAVGLSVSGGIGVGANPAAFGALPPPVPAVPAAAPPQATSSKGVFSFGRSRNSGSRFQFAIIVRAAATWPGLETKRR